MGNQVSVFLSCDIELCTFYCSLPSCDPLVAFQLHAELTAVAQYNR